MSKTIIDGVKQLLPDFDLELTSQGAEALVFVSDKHPYLPTEITPKLIDNTDKYVCKFRPKKPYRHPKLDLQITKSRTASEAKLLSKLETIGIKSPKLIAVDATNGIIWMEFLGYQLQDGSFSNLKNWLWYLEKCDDERLENGEDVASKAAIGHEVKQVMMNVGKSIAKLHLNEIVHGDLTSSNIVITGDNEIALIDFGLSSYSNLVEDKAVDLYVLEKALVSTHSTFSSHYNDWLLEGYHQEHSSHGKKGKAVWQEVDRRVALVRMRGRKRSQLG